MSSCQFIVPEVKFLRGRIEDLFTSVAQVQALLSAHPKFKVEKVTAAAPIWTWEAGTKKQSQKPHLTWSTANPCGYPPFHLQVVLTLLESPLKKKSMCNSGKSRAKKLWVHNYFRRAPRLQGWTARVGDRKAGQEQRGDTLVSPLQISVAMCFVLLSGHHRSKANTLPLSYLPGLYIV